MMAGTVERVEAWKGRKKKRELGGKRRKNGGERNELRFFWGPWKEGKIVLEAKQIIA